MSVVSAALRDTSSSLRTVFANRNLRRLNLAFAGSAVGDWAYATAITVWAYSVGGVAAVGLWGTARLVIMALLTPFAATLVDRYDRKRLMVTTDILRGSVILVCSTLIWVGAPPAFVFVLATLTSIFATPFRPAVNSLLPHLVDEPEELTAANGTISTIDSLSFFVGPALGGLLLTVASVPVVGLFNAATFVWSAVLVLGLAPHDRNVGKAAGAETVAEGTEEQAVGFLREASEGFRTIAKDRDLRLTTLVYSAQTVVAGASVVYAIEMAVQWTPFGPQGVGYLDSMFGIGAIVGGFVAIARASAGRVATDFGVGVILWAAPLMLAAAVPSVAPVLIALFIMGFGNPLVDVNAVTIVQRLSGDRVIGRVFGALESSLIAAMALGSVLMPLLIHFFGLRVSLAVLAVLITVVVVVAWSGLRRMDDELREPEGLVLLRQLPLFAPLEPKELELLARQLQRVEVGAGDAVIREGEPGDRFYVVDSGRLSASFQGTSLSTQGPGDPFGEIALLRDVPRTATVTADEPSVLWALDRDAFLAAVTGDSEVSGQADDLVSKRIPTF